MLNFKSFSEQRPRYRAQPELGDEGAADDEADGAEPEQDAPGLDGHQRQPVRVEQAHEHAAEEVVEGGEDDEAHQPRDRRDRLPGAPEVDGLGGALRVDYLRQVPAAVRFLSCEPLIGPLRLDL